MSYNKKIIIKKSDKFGKMIPIYPLINIEDTNMDSESINNSHLESSNIENIDNLQDFINKSIEIINSLSDNSFIDDAIEGDSLSIGNSASFISAYIDNYSYGDRIPVTSDVAYKLNNILNINYQKYENATSTLTVLNNIVSKLRTTSNVLYSDISDDYFESENPISDIEFITGKPRSMLNVGDTFTVNHQIFGECKCVVLAKYSTSPNNIYCMIYDIKNPHDNSPLAMYYNELLTGTPSGDINNARLVNSTLLKWLNSDNPSVRWLNTGYLMRHENLIEHPSTAFDNSLTNLHSMHSVLSLPGFLSGFDKSFVDLLKPMKIESKYNYTLDGVDYAETDTLILKMGLPIKDEPNVSNYSYTTRIKSDNGYFTTDFSLFGLDSFTSKAYNVINENNQLIASNSSDDMSILLMNIIDVDTSGNTDIYPTKIGKLTYRQVNDVITYHVKATDIYNNNNPTMGYVCPIFKI